MTIKSKLLVSLLAIAMISMFSTAVLWHAARTEQRERAADREYSNEFYGKTLEYAVVTKNLEIDVIQVQQFLTDVAATRGLDGQDTGFQEAADNAKDFHADLERATRLASEMGRADIAADLAEISRQFEPYYQAGIVMAEAYVAGGPQAGNPLMKAFDENASNLATSLQRLSADSQNLMKDMVAKVSARADRQLDQSNRMVFSVLSLSLLSLVAIGSVALFMYANLFAPLSKMTHLMNRLASGESNVEAPETKRTDEIGLMARAIAVFKESQAAKKSANRLREILDGLPIGVFVCNARDETILSNNLVRQMYLLTDDRVEGHSISEFIPGIERRNGGLAVAGKPLVPGQAVDARRADGSHFPCDVHSDVVEVDGAETFLWVVRDRTENVRLEERLRQAQKLESLGTIAGGIAHELNTPIQFVTDNTKFLADAFKDLRAAVAALVDQIGKEKAAVVVERFDLTYLDEEVPQAIDQSLEGLSRIAEIVLAVKRFSHPAGTEKEDNDLNEIVRTAALVSKNQWKYVADLVLNLEPNLPRVCCHAGELNQVFLNLIVNAAHAIEDNGGATQKGKISVTTRSVPGGVEVLVADTGAGIKPEIKDRIFDMFFTTKAPGRGTGQGLSLVHSIVSQNHGGTISVQSEPNQGATFSVMLPAAGTPSVV